MGCTRPYGPLTHIYTIILNLYICTHLSSFAFYSRDNPFLFFFFTTIYCQGPFGMQLLSSTPSSEELFTHNVTDYIYNSTGYTDANALSLEASIQRSIEEELYSSLEVHSACTSLEAFLFVFVFCTTFRMLPVLC
jgi:hypothetical protein